MKRSIKTAFAIALVALAVPAAALATRHDGRSRGNHQHQFQTGQPVQRGRRSAPSTQHRHPDARTGERRQRHRHSRRRHAHRLPGRLAALLLPRPRALRPRSAVHNPQARRYQHGDWGSTGPTGGTGSTGSTGPTGSTGDQGSGNGYPHHGYPHGYPQGGGGQGDDHHHFHHEGSGGPQHESCDSSLLIQGVSILNASLEITSRGAEFGEIVLLPAVQ